MKKNIIYRLIIGASILIGASPFLLKNYVKKLDESTKKMVLSGTYATSLIGLGYGTKKLADFSEENESQNKLEGELTN